MGASARESSPTGVDELDAAPAVAATKASPSLDFRLGHGLFSLCRRQAVCKAFADIASLSCDEVIWFLPAAFFISAGFFLRGAAALLRGSGIAQASCPEEVGCDMFATCCVCSAIEMACKLCFRRPRPPYVSKQIQTYVLPGEVWSFPSGHSMRAAAFAFWMSYGKNGALLASALGLPRPPPLAWTLPWAAAVAVARVAKGRHYPSDAAAGYALGVAVGFVVEGPALDLSDYHRGVVKVLGGVVVTGVWGSFFLTPLVAKATSIPKDTVLYPLYLAFYAAMLVHSVPRTEAGWNFGACGHAS